MITIIVQNRTFHGWVDFSEFTGTPEEIYQEMARLNKIWSSSWRIIQRREKVIESPADLTEDP